MVSETDGTAGWHARELIAPAGSFLRARLGHEFEEQAEARQVAEPKTAEHPARTLSAHDPSARQRLDKDAQRELDFLAGVEIRTGRADLIAL